MTKVWIIETGDYEENFVFGVAASLDSAVSYIKKTYNSPYYVVWSDVKMSGEGGATLYGYFAAVDGYSTKHNEEYSISEIEVQV